MNVSVDGFVKIKRRARLFLDRDEPVFLADESSFERSLPGFQFGLPSFEFDQPVTQVFDVVLRGVAPEERSNHQKHDDSIHRQRQISRNLRLIHEIGLP